MTIDGWPFRLAAGQGRGVITRERGKQKSTNASFSSFPLARARSPSLPCSTTTTTTTTTSRRKVSPVSRDQIESHIRVRLRTTIHTAKARYHTVNEAKTRLARCRLLAGPGLEISAAIGRKTFGMIEQSTIERAVSERCGLGRIVSPALRPGRRLLRNIATENR
jgi:hypothetical protein